MGTPLPTHACSLGPRGTLYPANGSLHRGRPAMALQRGTGRGRHAKPVTPSCSLASPQQHPPGALAEAGSCHEGARGAPDAPARQP